MTSVVPMRIYLAPTLTSVMKDSGLIAPFR
jgi:hypothetical protein